MDKDNIIKSQFSKFKKLRRSGRINMTDIRNGAILISESEDVYETIMWNYSYLENKFYGKAENSKNS